MTLDLRLSDYHITCHEMRCLLAKAAFGLSDKEIGRAYGISQQTVRNHLYNLRQRINARTTPHAVYILWPVLSPLLDKISMR